MTSATDILPPLRAAAQAYGMTKLAADTGLGRQALYRMLADDGNPTLSSLCAILRVLNWRLVARVEPVKESARYCPACAKARFDFDKDGFCGSSRDEGCVWGGEW